jgi:hypothetical protein
MLGQVVNTINLPVGAGEVYRRDVNISNLPTGAYSVQINDGVNSSTRTVIKN